MITIIIQVIVGALGGIAASLQVSFAGTMGQKLGNLESVFITYVGGAIVIFLITLGRGGGNLEAWRSVPWYVLLAGPLGLVIIGSLSFNVPRIGVAMTNTLFVATWLIVSAIMDHVGLFGVTQRPLALPRLLGIATLLLGTWLVVRE